MKSFTELPKDLPVPVDDGACAHLPGMMLPGLRLQSTAGKWVDLSSIPARTVIYFYPMTGRPGVALPDGWDQIPGARGCTPQSCAFRGHYSELKAFDTAVFGVSTQGTDYQREVAERLHLPFELLSDDRLELATALSLPLFQVDGKLLTKRITMVVEDGTIVKVFYPVFPPDRNADTVLAWLRTR